MLLIEGKCPDTVSDDELNRLYEKHLLQIKNWITNQPNIKYIEVNYNRCLVAPNTELQRLDEFFDKQLDVEEMISVIEPDLYRQRK